MAQLKFYRRAQAPTSPVEGTIWFNTTDKTIQIYAKNAWEKYAGNLKDATWSGSTLTITKHDGSSIALDFSDMASAATMSKIIAAAGLNNDGTFKKNATNYGGNATTIGGEIANIDSALKTLDGTVSTNYTTLDGKIDSSINSIKGELAEDDLKTLEAINDELDNLSSSIGSLGNMVATEYVKSTAFGTAITALKGTSTDAPNKETIYGAKNYADQAIANLDSSATGENTHVNVTVTQTDGKITAVSVEESDIASAVTLAEVKATVDTFFAGADMDAEQVEAYRDTLKELQTYMNEDAAAASTMANNISKNKSEIDKLANTKINGVGFVKNADGTLSSTNIALTGADLRIAGYTKGSASDLAATDTINDALGKLEARVDAAAAGGVQSVNGKTGSITIAEGTTNGTISVGDADVAVHGLGTAAYKAEGDFATAAQGAKADTAYQKPSTGIPKTDLASAVQTSLDKADAAAPQSTTYTKTEVDTMLSWAEFE